MNWDDLRIFLAVARAPSLRAAADAIGVSHTTVARRLDTLEEDIGQSLFVREGRGLALTHAGQDLLPIAESLASELEALQLRVHGQDSQLAGPLSITMPELLVTHLFLPILQDFMAQYPDISLRVDDSSKLFDLSQREADIAIRLSNAPPDHLIGRNLGMMAQASYGHIDYLARHDPDQPDSGARWIGWGKPVDDPAWVKSSRWPNLALFGHFDNIDLQYRLVAACEGLGHFPCLLAGGNPALRRLSETEPFMPVWMLSHRDMRTNARVQAFRRFIGERADEIRARLEGTG